jgi:hypothetical protein
VSTSVSKSDGVAVALGFQGFKYGLDHFVEEGLGGSCRLPLGPPSEQLKKAVVQQMKEDFDFEDAL